MQDSSPWWDPARHEDRRPFLLARGRVKRALQAWFDNEGFTEVEPTALCASPGNEAHLHAFETSLEAPDGSGRPVYLHTSPEFAMKKLLAAGETRIAAFAPVWRNREDGTRHASEFTMLEWYRARAPYWAVMDDTVDLIRAASSALGAGLLVWRGHRVDPFAPPEQVAVAEAFTRHAGIDLLATCAADGSTDRDALARQCAAASFAVSDDDTWSDLFSKLLTARVEPHLGRDRLTILDEYPAAEAALARRSAADPRVAERFEVYACGVELANGFGELTDAGEQRKRFTAEMDEKERLYGTRYPLDEDFLSALSHMPDASGVALGFDRLVMLASGAPTIEHVRWTPAP